MIKKHIKLFNLTSDSSLEDIKKAYRKLAKQHHPDRFTDEAQKSKQDRLMVYINDAYKKALIDFKSRKMQLESESKEEDTVKSDFALYKKAMQFYSIYFDSFFELFAKRAVHTIKEKEAVLEKSRAYFIQLKQEYSDSDWIYDSEEKLKKIDKALKYLDDSKKVYNNLDLKDSKHY